MDARNQHKTDEHQRTRVKRTNSAEEKVKEIEKSRRDTLEEKVPTITNFHQRRKSSSGSFFVATVTANDVKKVLTPRDDRDKDQHEDKKHITNH